MKATTKPKKKKIKEIQLPQEYNPLISRYEPVLPLRRNKDVIFERKRNWWAFWYIVISLLIFIIQGLYFLIKYFIK